MPEGDTLFRTARALQAALAGQPLTRFDSSLVAVAAAARRLALVGRTVAGVEARGKHLLVRFEGGAALHTHLGLHGSWRVLAPGADVRLGQRVRALLATPRALALCLSAPRVELLPPGAEARHAALGGLGPDLLDPGFDLPKALARLRLRDAQPIGVALLDQRATAGMGNVYKSEVLFACGIDPRRPVGGLAEVQLRALLESARGLLQRNLGPGLRRTTAPPCAERLFVYRRGGRPCLRCGATIERIVQAGRSTWLCPACQSPS